MGQQGVQAELVQQEHYFLMAEMHQLLVDHLV
jgi:hypothetical protein